MSLFIFCSKFKKESLYVFALSAIIYTLLGPLVVTLHYKQNIRVQRVTTTELWLLRVLCSQHVADAIEQLDVALARVLLEGRDKGPAHGARGLLGNHGVGRRLVVLAAGKHDHVGRRRLGLDGLVVAVVAAQGLVGEAHDGRNDAADVAARVGRDGAQGALARLGGQVGLLEHALGRVDVGQVHGGARVARVENGRKPHAGLKRLDHNVVNVVVDNVAGRLVIDGINDLVVPIVLVAVQVLGLSSVAREMQKQRVVGLGPINQPLHGAYNVGFCGLPDGIGHVVGQDDHVLHFVIVPLN